MIGGIRKAARRRASHVLLDEREPFVVHEIGFRQRDDRVPHAEQLENREVLARLRHDAFVGGHHDEREIDARGAGDHRPNERLVARDVDDADRPDAVERERREPELDRDAAPLLLGQPIGVHAGEREHERRLAVIDVAGGAEDHAAPPVQASRSHTSNARSGRSSARCSRRNSRNNR